MASWYPAHDSAGTPAASDRVTERGVVVEVLEEGVRVETQRRGGCASCSARGGCGVGLMQQALSRRSHTVVARCEYPVRMGDEVELSLPHAALVQASLWMYFVPLLGLLVGAVLGQQVASWWILSTDASALLGAAAGFLGAIRFVASRQAGQMRSGRYAPSVTRVLPAFVRMDAPSS